MRRLAFAAGIPVAAIILSACSAAGPSASTAAPPPAPAATHAAAAAKPSPGCTAPTFDYIVRVTEPGSVPTAQEIGNCDLVTGQDALDSFQATASAVTGACTTIAKASDNAGYDVSSADPGPLKDVIESAPLGCG